MYKDYNACMTIYLDIFFLENFLMNYIILFGTAFAQKIKINKIRAIISDLIGTLYAIIICLKIIPTYCNVFIKVTISIIMIYIAFKPHSAKSFVKSLLIFYLISFATGGCSLALMYLIAPQRIVFEDGRLIGMYPMSISLIAGGLGFITIQCAFEINKRKLDKKDLICKLRIKICGKTVSTRAFIDSGNSLKDPLTLKPVIIIENRLIKKALDLKDNYINECEGGDSKLGIRLIPYKSIGKQNGILMGVMTEYVEIKYDNESIVKNNVIIGLYNEKIGKNYSALVGLDFIYGGNADEFNSNFEKNIFQCIKK